MLIEEVHDDIARMVFIDHHFNNFLNQTLFSNYIKFAESIHLFINILYSFRYMSLTATHHLYHDHQNQQDEYFEYFFVTEIKLYYN